VEYVPKVLTAAAFNSFEVYGDSGTKASAMLAGFGAVIFPHWQAFLKLLTESIGHFLSILEGGAGRGRRSNG
jgi:hypothetical protein